MKYLIASDIHGSAYYCRLLRERFLEEGAARLILLGDLLYHGARNPLPRDYSTLACADILNSMKESILCVKGNCDSEVDSLVLEFPVEANALLLPVGGRTILFTHGHKEIALPHAGDVLFCGHFHVPAFEARGEGFYANCGSVSIPKEGSRHSYALLEGDRIVWKDVETGEEFLEKTLSDAALSGEKNIS